MAPSHTIAVVKSCGKALKTKHKSKVDKPKKPFITTRKPFDRLSSSLSDEAQASEPKAGPSESEVCMEHNRNR